MCDVCHYRCSPEERVDENVVVWRCEKDKRHPGGDLGGPGGAQTGQNIERRENNSSVTSPVTEVLPDYRSEAVRLASFTNWTVPYIQPADLASAGFYFLNEEDSCRY